MDYILINDLGGKARGLKFNQYTYIKFYEKVSPDDYIATFHYAAVFAALKSNAYVKGEEFTDTWEDVCNMVDAMSAEDKALVADVFNNTAYFKKAVEDGEKIIEEEKKSQSLSTTKTA